MAAVGGDIPKTQALLAASADVNDKPKARSTGLLIAIIRGHTKYGEFLLHKGADPNAGPGFTPFDRVTAKHDHRSATTRTAAWPKIRSGVPLEGWADPKGWNS
jgi:ankyrin repeat protein